MIHLSTWSENISNVLNEFSNIDFQKRIWLQGKGPEVSSFGEAFCKLFDDFVFEDFLRLPEVINNVDLYSSLCLVYFALKAITDDIMNDEKISEDFLVSPMWQSVMNLAKQAKGKLDKERLQWHERVLN